MLLELPPDMLRLVVGCVADLSSSAESPLLALDCVCRGIHAEIDDTVWAKAWRQLLKSHPNASREARKAPPDISDHQLVKLCSTRKCMMCRTSRCSPKIYWAFQVRCCRPCLAMYTYTAGMLARRFNLKDACWKGVSYMNAKTFNDRLYLRSAVHSVLALVYQSGTLQEYDEKMALVQAARRHHIVQTCNVEEPEELDMSNTFRKLVEASLRAEPVLAHVIRLVPRIRREIEHEKWRRAVEKRRKAESLQKQRAQELAVITANRAWERSPEELRIPCPLCSDKSRLFARPGLLDHVRDAHHEPHRAARSDRKAPNDFHWRARYRWIAQIQ